MTNRRSRTSYPSGGTPPIHMPLRLEAAILSRMLQRRSFHRAARQTTIVISSFDQTPSLTGLAPDERLAGLALGLQRVEVLFEALLRTLARVDRAAASRSSGTIHRRAPEPWL